MINEQENKTSLTKLSPEEYEKNQTEMSRYRVNGLTYRLALLAMFTGLFATLVLLNSMTPNIHSFIIVMLIIVILLGGFLAAEKAKSYSLKGSIALGVFGGVTLIEFIYPVILMINFTKFINNYKGADDAARAEWFDVENVPSLAFDHNEILSVALQELGLNAAEKTEAKNLGGTKSEKFAMGREAFELAEGNLSDILEQIRKSAHQLHADVNQTYGDGLPYGFHIDMVADAVRRYGH